MIICGDALELPLADQSVQCVVTSPPYYGLRKYSGPDLIWADGWTGQLGLEPTPELFTQHLVEIFREVWRVLRKDGTVWLNLGDSYNAAGRVGHGTRTGYKQQTNRASANGHDENRPSVDSLKPKDLLGIPWRAAFALQADGWYLRSDIIWAKPNPMPESVQDRPTRSHEYLFLLTKAERYYYDHEAIKERANLNGKGNARSFRGGGKYTKGQHFTPDPVARETHGNVLEVSGTRNARSVWAITPKPFRGAHFATFPPELPERCIKAGTPEGGCCAICHTPLVRVIEKGAPLREQQLASGSAADGTYGGSATKDFAGGGAQDASATKARILAGMVERRTIGWKQTCKCPLTAPPVPALVVDPFGGSGTTALVAERLGRRGLAVDLSSEYVGIAKARASGERESRLTDKQAGHSRRHAGFNARWKAQQSGTATSSPAAAVHQSVPTQEVAVSPAETTTAPSREDSEVPPRLIDLLRQRG